MNRSLKMGFLIILLVLWVIPSVNAQDNSFRLTLADALQMADKMNLQVMMADARVEQAIARLAESRADLLPHIDGTLNTARQTADLRYEGLSIPLPGLSSHQGPYNNFDARARVTMSLFDLAAFERFKAAQKEQKLSEAQKEKTREDVLALVAQLYVDAQRKEQTVALLNALLERDKLAYDINESNAIQGLGTAIDASKFKSALDQTRYLLAQATLQADDARLDLSAALQLPLERPLIFADDKEFLKTLQGKAAVNFKDAVSPDLMVASSQLQALHADEKTAYADFLPKLSGTANYGRSGESPQRGSNTYFVGLQATVPVWEGGAQQAHLKEVKGRVKEAKENLKDTSQQVEVKIAKARQEMVETSQLLDAKAQQKRTAQKALVIAFHAQQIGAGSVLEVLQAKADLASAEDGYNEAQAAWIMAHIDLLYAQGRLRQLVKGEQR